MFEKIARDIARDLPAVDKIVKDSTEKTFNTIDRFLSSVVRGTAKFLESPFRDTDKEKVKKPQD